MQHPPGPYSPPWVKLAWSWVASWYFNHHRASVMMTMRDENEMQKVKNLPWCWWYLPTIPMYYLPTYDRRTYGGRTVDGWTGRTVDGRTDGWRTNGLDGLTDGRADGQRMDWRTDWNDGRTDWRIDKLTVRRTDGRGMDGQRRERERWQREQECEREWERQRRIQQGGSASGSVASERGLEGVAREVVCWRIGKCVTAGWKRKRECALAVAGVGASGSASGQPQCRGRPGAFAIECGRLWRRPRRCVPTIFVSLAEARGTSCRAGVQNHSTTCLFLQQFLESEREVLNALLLTNLSTFVFLWNYAFGISTYSFLYFIYSFFSLVRAFYLSSCVPHLRCNCHHGSKSFFSCLITENILGV